MSRRKEVQSREELERFNDAMHIFPTVELAREMNEARLLQLEQHVTVIESIDHEEIVGCSSASNDDENYVLQNILSLAIGCRVMLITNKYADKGPKGGTMGYLREIAYTSGTSSTTAKLAEPSPAYLLVEFDDYEGKFMIYATTNFFCLKF